MEEYGEVVVLRIESDAARREVGDGHGRSKQEPSGSRRHQIENVTTVSMEAAHGIDHIGRRDLIQHVAK
jgi:hypothetical protein